jgi:aminopeptidase N
LTKRWKIISPFLTGIDIDNEPIVTVTDQKICNISISQLKETQLGDWKCRISHNASPQYQEAYLSVTKTGKSQTVRLPKHLRPEKYFVFLTPFIIIDNFTIQGHVDININVLEGGAKNVTLHSENIQIFENTVTIKDSNENDIAIEGFGYDAARQFFVIHTSEALTQGDAITLSIDFLAELNSGVAGFYRSSYFDEEKNATEYLATTQFQVADARQALPCFDEPAYKAVFQANLGRLKDMNSISNMPVEFEGVPMSDNDVYVWDIYQETPLISTYLLAFIISRYTFKQGKVTSNGVDFKFWSRKSVSEHTALSVEVAPKILEFYENNFNVSYPLPKLDMAAIPDFGAKGMENWGLITYLESFVIFKENESTFADKERVVHVTAHEIAHQWFGNLVTMEWWTE